MNTKAEIGKSLDPEFVYLKRVSALSQVSALHIVKTTDGLLIRPNLRAGIFILKDVQGDVLDRFNGENGR